MTVGEVASEHFRHGQAWLRHQLPPYSNVSELSSGPLRIGYLSPDFGHHPVGKIMLAVLQAHDRTRYHITCYSDRGVDDPWTEKIRENVDEFRNTYSMTDRRLLDLMREDNLSVAIELSGHTGGRNRLSVLAARVAPLQVSFLGYPNTTGVDGIDCFVTDRFCDPPGSSDSLHLERLLRLDSGFLCFDRKRPSAPFWFSVVGQDSSGAIEFAQAAFEAGVGLGGRRLRGVPRRGRCGLSPGVTASRYPGEAVHSRRSRPATGPSTSFTYSHTSRSFR